MAKHANTKPKARPTAKKPPAKPLKPAAKKAENGGKVAAGAKAAVAKIKPPAARKTPDLSDKLIHLIAEEMAIEEAELTPNASFKEDLGLDEIDVAELLMQAEQVFGVPPFSEEDWENCETVAEFIALVESRADPKSRAVKKA